jgi:hypothetical protein
MVGSTVTAAATLALAIIARWQLQELRLQQQGWESLKICQQYDFDPVLNQTLGVLRQARRDGSLAADPLSVRFEIVIVLNYLEGIATGIEQGFYNETIVQEHMLPIMIFHVEEVLNSDISSRLQFEPQDYERLKKFVEKWTRKTVPWYMRRTV